MTFEPDGGEPVQRPQQGAKERERDTSHVERVKSDTRAPGHENNHTNVANADSDQRL